MSSDFALPNHLLNTQHGGMAMLSTQPNSTVDTRTEPWFPLENYGSNPPKRRHSMKEDHSSLSSFNDFAATAQQFRLQKKASLSSADPPSYHVAHASSSTGYLPHTSHPPFLPPVKPSTAFNAHNPIPPSLNPVSQLPLMEDIPTPPLTPRNAWLQYPTYAAPLHLHQPLSHSHPPHTSSSLSTSFFPANPSPQNLPSLAHSSSLIPQEQQQQVHSQQQQQSSSLSSLNSLLSNIFPSTSVNPKDYTTLPSRYPVNNQQQQQQQQQQYHSQIPPPSFTPTFPLQLPNRPTTFPHPSLHIPPCSHLQHQPFYPANPPQEDGPTQPPKRKHSLIIENGTPTTQTIDDDDDPDDPDDPSSNSDDDDEGDDDEDESEPQQQQQPPATQPTPAKPRKKRTTQKRILHCPHPTCPKHGLPNPLNALPDSLIPIATFQTLHALRSHVRCHREAHLQCPECPQRFRRGHDLARHRRSS
ncbi:hypothetical protein BC829DRAFT_415736 [Chytridium lagenaria]|nr:hypothetical protein BC829DRAFT_415736 [Chytridium lagenaria]